MTTEKILLVGGGGHCHSVIDVIEQENKYDIAGIIDQKDKIGQTVMGYPVIGSDEDLSELAKSYHYAVITIGQLKISTVREALFNKLNQLGFNLPVIISPLAYVAKSAKIDKGTVVMHHALINANVSIGKCCIINTKALIEHDAGIEDFCHISTASVINGSVQVKAGSFFGSNATSKQSIEINGFIKAGSLTK